ncbi:MAG: DUF268 domain-containing protein [Bacteroidales bacterium]|nr:DUF268 domain-containing protein [Bacteroidales bacterium]
MIKRINNKLQFRKDLKLFKLGLEDNKDFAITKLYPILNEKRTPSGSLPKHYFHQDLHVAGRIFENNPDKHVDIGSRIDGFVTHVASFREIEVFDIRALDHKIKNIKFTRVDFSTSNLGIENYCDSISSLHAIEHFGLGRYGDTIDVNGHLKGMDNIYKVLKPGGIFYFSVPIGPQRVEFNAHRVFSVKYLLSLFEKKYTIEHFSYESDDRKFYKDAELTEMNIIQNFGCHFGCGIFELRKR